MDKDKQESELLSCWESLKKEIFGVCDRLSAAEAENTKLKAENERLREENIVKPAYTINSECKPNKEVIYCFRCATYIKDQKYCHGCGGKIDWQALKD